MAMRYAAGSKPTEVPLELFVFQEGQEPAR